MAKTTVVNETVEEVKSVEEFVPNEVIVEGEVINRNEMAVSCTVDIFKAGNSEVFSSIKGDDRATKIKIYNAVNGSENALSDHLKETLMITDMVAHPIQLTDEVTGELVDCLRVVLVAEDGTAYHSVSNGVVGSLQKILPIVGSAPWTPALPIIPTEVKTRKGFKTLTLALGN